MLFEYLKHVRHRFREGSTGYIVAGSQGKKEDGEEITFFVQLIKLKNWLFGHPRHRQM